MELIYSIQQAFMIMRDSIIMIQHPGFAFEQMSLKYGIGTIKETFKCFLTPLDGQIQMKMMISF
jgi:hypothetical protein